MQLIRNIIDILPQEGSRVSLCALQTADLAEQALHQMADGHSTRNSVGVHNHIGHDAFASKGQVFLSVSHSTSSLLTVSTRKLVTDLGNSNSSHLDLSKSDIILISGEYHLINNSALRMSHRNRAVLERLRNSVPIFILSTLSNHLHLPNNYIVSTHLHSGRDQSIQIKFVVTAVFYPHCLRDVGSGELLVLLLSIVVGSEEY